MKAVNNYVFSILICLATAIPVKIYADITPLISVNNDVAVPNNVEATIYGSGYSEQTVFNNQFFALFESANQIGDIDFKLGIKASKDELQLNQFQFNAYQDDIEIQFGKYVTQVGVLDFFGNMGNLNPLNIEYYEEENIHIRRQSTWLSQINFYPDEDSTARLIIAPYDSKRRQYLNSFLDITYQSGIPYLLQNTGDENIDLIAREVLVPVYEDRGGRAAIEGYIENELPEDQVALDTTTFLFDYFTYYKDAKIGLTYVNGFSNIPRIEIDKDLIGAIANIDEDKRNEYIFDYLSKDDNAPIKFIEYSRFNQVVAYGETTLNSLGLRGELSYRDRFPLINEYTKQVNIGVGLDHQGTVYNNLEVQYSVLQEGDLKSYFALWQLSFDKYHLGLWQWQFENTATLAVVDEESAWAIIPSLSFTLQNLAIKLRYLHHSQEDFSNNIGMVQMKVIF